MGLTFGKKIKLNILSLDGGDKLFVTNKDRFEFDAIVKQTAEPGKGWYNVFKLVKHGIPYRLDVKCCDLDDKVKVISKHTTIEKIINAGFEFEFAFTPSPIFRSETGNIKKLLTKKKK